MFTRVTGGGPNKRGVCVCVWGGGWGAGVGSLNQITGGVKISGGIGNFDKIKKKGYL